MEKYNKLLRNITELIEKGLFSSKDLKKAQEVLNFKEIDWEKVDQSTCPWYMIITRED